MVTSIKARLNISRSDKDEMYPLSIQLLKGGKKRLISLGYSLKKEWFDKEKETVRNLPAGKGGKRKVKEVNFLISQEKKMLLQLAVRLGKEYPEYTVQELQQAYYKMKDCQYLSSFVHQECDLLLLRKKNGTALQYECMLNSVRMYCRAAGISEEPAFTHITSSFVAGYRKFLEERGLKDSSILTYISNLRAVYNKARHGGIFCVQRNPFERLLPRGMPSSKRALSPAIIRKIAEVPLECYPSLMHARDILLASFYMEGMGICDIMHLRYSNIEEQVITCRRKKTGALLTFAIQPGLQALIDKYASSDSHLFPFLLNDRKQTHRDYRNCLRRINRNLKKLETFLSLPVHLSTHVPRHTWASLAQECNVPVEKISQALGHTSIKTTEIYLKGFCRKAIDQVNETVITYCMAKNGNA